MSRDFVKKGMNADGIYKAQQQQRDILYFIESETQGDVTLQKLENWADRNFQTNVSYLDYVKTVLKQDVAISSFKHLRFPLVSAQLVNDKILPDFQRVFHAEDSYSKYSINGNNVEQPEELNSSDFNETLLDALFFRYNDIVVVDIEDTNKPKRNIVPIDKVISIDCDKSNIYRIAYKARINNIEGVVYIDENYYAFYPNDEEIKSVEVTHDLQECPADFISNKSFSDCVIRKSIFTYIKTYMEDFVFLNTLRKMLDINGTVPSVTVLKAREIRKANTADGKGSSDQQPSEANVFGGQKASKKSLADPNQISPHEAGAKTEVPINIKNDGTIDTNYVQNYIKYHYAPVDILKFIDERIDKLEKKIVSSVVGNYSEMNKEAVNEKQVGQSFVSMEDRLRQFSAALSRIIKRSEFKHLALQHGRNKVSVDLSLGTDFFLLTASEVYETINSSPNPIEARNLLSQLAKSKGNTNREKSKRDDILYKLLPYTTSESFKTAVDNNQVGEITFQYYTRFNYWIDLFEAKYGDLYEFWSTLDLTKANDSLKLVTINNLLTQIIKSNYERIESVEPKN